MRNGDTNCDLGLSHEEREFVVDFIQKLDLTIEDAAMRADFVFVGAAVNAFDGHQLCDDQAGANHLKLMPPEGSELGRYSPATWIPGSMHPNVLGHELTAVATVCPVAQALSLTPVSGSLGDGKGRPFDCPAAPPPEESDGQADADVGVSEVCQTASAIDGEPTAGETAACEAAAGAVSDRIDELAAGVSVVTDDVISDDEWISVELWRTVRALALPLVLLLAAGIVFAWGFAQLSNPLSRFLRQEQTDLE